MKACICFLLLASGTALGFTARPAVSRLATKPSSIILYDSAVEVKIPSQADAVTLGARDWPQQLKTGSWSERVDNNVLAARYILDGTGSIQVTLYDEAGNMKTARPSSHKLVPGSFVEAMGPATIDWTVDDQMIVLTPGYEQGSLFAAVAALFVVLCGVLISQGGL